MADFIVNIVIGTIVLIAFTIACCIFIPVFIAMKLPIGMARSRMEKKWDALFGLD